MSGLISEDETNMEKEPGVLEDAIGELGIVIRWILSGLIEAVFIICWVITQWIVNEYVVTRFKVEGTDKTILVIAQWLFGIATLAPILFFLIQLIMTMAIRTWKNIHEEIRKIK